jgi:hypothetical protein
VIAGRLRTDNGFVKWLKFDLFAEDDTGCQLHLHEAPMVAGAETLVNGAELFGSSIQSPVKLRGIQAVGNERVLFGIGKGQEHIIRHLEGYAGFVLMAPQPAMAVGVDRQAKRRPSGHPDITEPERLIDEVEVAMEAIS